MRLDEFEIDADSDIIIGRDFNVILDCDMDGFGGKPKLKIAGKKIENLCSSYLENQKSRIQTFYMEAK